jgi:hypothetical protein
MLTAIDWRTREDESRLVKLIEQAVAATGVDTIGPS